MGQNLIIGLIGYGRMGKKIEELAAPHQTTQKLSDADVWVDFSHPDVVLEHVSWAANMKKPLVIGTTGWDKELLAVKERARDIGVIYSPNFSLGMHFFAALLKRASELFKGYEVAGVEMHHSGKVDKPSGSAKLLAEVVPGLEFSSVRCGSITGQHTLIFDSLEDTITLTHEAKSRDAFAKGAIRAAEWIVGKRGFYTMEDFLKDH